MAIIRVNKVEAARRHIDTAIKMLFGGWDSVPIHTVACAGHRVLRDICEAKGTPYALGHKTLFLPGKETEFWTAFNKSANFLKHADRDADEILDNIDDRINDLILMSAAMYYIDLGNSLTPGMAALVVWARHVHPDVYASVDADFFTRHFGPDLAALRNMDRVDQLAFGARMLPVFKQFARG